MSRTKFSIIQEGLDNGYYDISNKKILIYHFSIYLIPNKTKIELFIST